MGTVTASAPARMAWRKASAAARDSVLDLLALSFLLVLSLLLLSRQILLGGTFYNDDIVLQSIPVYSWFAEGLKQGRIPIWSPAILGGFPLAFAQYGFFYPPDMLLFLLFDPARAFHISLAIHLTLAGICTYWYCRLLQLRRLPSLLAAVAFQMGSEVTSWPANGYISKTLFVIPALLATIELMLRNGLRYWLLIPLIIGGALLVGYAQIVLFALVVGGVYALVAALVPPRSGAGTVVGFLALLSMGVLMGFGLAAVRVAPTLMVTSLSTRAEGMGMEQLTADSIEPWALVAGYLMPVVFELPGMAVARPDYLGAAALLLALAGVVLVRRWGRVQAFHTVLAAVAIVLSLGKFTPAYGLLLHLPFFSYFHGPNRLSLLAALAAGLVAAIALDRKVVLDLASHKRRYWVALAIAILAGLLGAIAVVLSVLYHFGRDPLSDALRAAGSEGWGLLSVIRLRSGLPLLGLAVTPFVIIGCANRWISHGTLECTALVLTVVTLTALGWVRYSWMPPSALHEPPELLGSLREDTGLYRVFSWAPRLSTYNVGAYYQGIVGSPPSIEFNERYLRQYVPPNLGMLFGVATADGYEALQSRRQALVVAHMGSERIDPARYRDGSGIDAAIYGRSLHDRLNLLAALNVKYLLHAFPIEDLRLEAVQEVAVRIYPWLDATAKVHLYRLKSAMPRAYVVPGSVVMGSERQVLESLMAGTVELYDRVILEEQPPSLEGPVLTGEGSWVEIGEYRDDRVSLVARTDGSGFLVLMDFLLPGWTATVDGRLEPVLAGNFAGRVVPLRGPGEHRVEFRYEAPLFREGLGLSVFSLLLLVSVPSAVWLSRRRRRRCS